MGHRSSRLNPPLTLLSKSLLLLSLSMSFLHRCTQNGRWVRGVKMENFQKKFLIKMQLTHKGFNSLDIFTTTSTPNPEFFRKYIICPSPGFLTRVYKRFRVIGVVAWLNPKMHFISHLKRNKFKVEKIGHPSCQVGFLQMHMLFAQTMHAYSWC